MTKLKADYQDTIVNGKRKYIRTVNQDSTVSFENASDYIKPEFNVTANIINLTNLTINETITQDEELADDIEDADSRVDGVSSGETVVGYATEAVTSGSATSVQTATTSDATTNDFILVNRGVLMFSGTTCTIYDSRVTADSLVNVYYENKELGKNIIASADVSRVILKAEKAPTATIRATVRVRTV